MPIDYVGIPRASTLEVGAIQSLRAGEATPDQQITALEWIVRVAAMKDEDPFVPGQSDITNYRMGRRAVGLAIVRELNSKLNNPQGGMDD